MSSQAGSALVHELEIALTRAGSVDDALGRLAKALADRVPLARVSLRLLDPDRDELVMVGLWCQGHTKITRGFRTSAVASVLVEARRYGRPVFSQQVQARPTVLDQVLREEGMVAWVVIPLFRRGEIVGLLGFASVEPETIDPTDGEYWAEVGRIVQEPLLELATPPAPGLTSREG